MTVWPIRKLVFMIPGVILACAFAMSAMAAEERRLSGEQIHDLLANAKVVGKGFEQTFGDPRGSDSASTTYWEGKNTSYGRWRVSSDKYCSVWSNPDYWACYKVLVSKTGDRTKVIWIDDGGRRFEGVIVKR